ncbi:Gfo/Idh/MocA family oxidoreductase [Streptomyces sp. NPDC048193]|uniref:Gfo/Idh/MocA family protein n=1 Tax=unclassified Streptomyces TaxID=2593676 RepID=UPI003446988C
MNDSPRVDQQPAASGSLPDGGPVATGPEAWFTAPSPSRRRVRYAVAGTGHRARMYTGALTGDHADVGELVAWLDPNPARMAWYDREAGSALGLGGPAGLPQYGPEALEDMLAHEAVDVLVVTSVDRTHAELVDRAVRAGVKVIVEKPLTTDAEGCRRIGRAVAETGRDVVVTFNYRYAPRNATLRQVIASGAIGQVTSVHFEWVLDTVHGADYFRRWHRDKSNSGGLLVHKASHHFDLVNWWLDDDPVRVFASGALRFYGDAAAADRGLTGRPERGTGTTGDPFSLDLRADPRLDALYLRAEHHDGYRRDADPFAPGITIEDNMAVLVDYRRGATLTYSLNAHSPWEGYRVCVNGTGGRAELTVVERGFVELDDEGNAVLDPSATAAGSPADSLRPEGETVLVQRHWQRPEKVPVPSGTGGHGGGDALLLMDLFRGDLRIAADPLRRAADHTDGIRAVSVGIAANRSLVTGQPVLVADLDLGPGAPHA